MDAERFSGLRKFFVGFDRRKRFCLFFVPCCKGDVLAENILDDLEVGCQDSEKFVKGFVTGSCFDGTVVSNQATVL